MPKKFDPDEGVRPPGLYDLDVSVERRQPIEESAWMGGESGEVRNNMRHGATISQHYTRSNNLLVGIGCSLRRRAHMREKVVQLSQVL